MITPTGAFSVDIILSKEDRFDAIDPQYLDRYKAQQLFFRLVSSKAGLKELFGNMDSIDFDRDGKPDEAYGSAYIGLSSQHAITGPKMSMYGKIPYWFSIALHGFPNQAVNAARTASGGCVHLNQNILNSLISSRQVKIGTTVEIR